MSLVSFEIPEDVKNIITRYPQINWDELVQHAIWDYAKKIKLVNAIAQKSKLTLKMAKQLDNEIKTALLKKYKG